MDRVSPEHTLHAHSQLRQVQCSIDAHGTALTEETIAAAKSADAVLLGGPECGNGAIRPEPGLLKLRKGMDIYGNLYLFLRVWLSC